MKKIKNINKNNLTSGNIFNSIILFTIPVLLGILLQQCYTTIDAIIIGRFAGKDALASIEAVTSILKLPTNFFMGLSSGATIIISNYYGAENFKKVSNMCHTAMLFAFVGGLIASIVGVILSPQAINMVHVPENIREDALIYIKINFGGLVFLMIYNIGTGIYRAIGNSKIPLYFLLIANVVNIILDILFIAIWDMGVIGASLATVVSQLISAVLTIISLCKIDMSCRIVLKNFLDKNNYVYYREDFMKIIKLGLPVGVQYTIYPIANTLIQTNINNLGVNAIASWAVCGKLDMLVWNLAEALGITTSTFVAQNIGYKQYERSKKGVIIISIISLVSTGIIASILYYYNSTLASFLVEDEEVIILVGEIVNLIGPLYILYPIGGGVLPAAIRAYGEAIKPMIITIICTCMLRIIWLFVVVPIKPTLIVILMCYPITWFATTVTYIVYYKRFLLKFKELKI